MLQRVPYFLLLAIVVIDSIILFNTSRFSKGLPGKGEVPINGISNSAGFHISEIPGKELTAEWLQPKVS